ncbi:MAG TPA: 30S ribosomal protein S20 [Candidatus Limnocylindrales bacterium]|nr:30S ribosomal protein S20 [Candidatus Limnocylindrales bacterium]
MAKTPRTWTGARSPSGLKRVRSSARRHEILQPRRSAAKTLVKSALVTAASANGDGAETATAIAEAMSALDRAAKVGAIHPNAAARRKSRLVRTINAMAGGTHVTAGAIAKTVSRAQAQKAAKARIAAGKADKAKGAQTAAGKARAALTRTSRSESADAAKATTTATAAAPTKAVSRGGTAAKAAPKGGTAAKAAAKPSTKSGSTNAKASATKAATSKASAAKPAAKAAPKKAAKS